jgi:peptidoglycan/LPS O-acetylase OafA/YrhL
LSKKIETRFEFPDFARGYAILTIVLFHIGQRLQLPPLWSQAIGLGGTGVHLFFFLSGWGLAQSSLAEQPLLFYRRRLSKIWLPYAVVLTLSWCTGLFPDTWESWLAGLLLYQMFSGAAMESFGGHFWFISTIIQFYLAFPLLWWLSRRYSALWFALGCLGVSVLWWCMVYLLGQYEDRSWNSSMFQFLWEFGLGMVFSSLLQQPMLKGVLRFWRPNAWWGWLLAGVCFVAVMIMMILKMGTIGRVFNDIPAFAGYSCLAIGVFWWSTHYAAQLRSFFEWVGAFSFTLYLLHILVLELLLLAISVAGMSLSLLWVAPYVMLSLLVAWWLEPYFKRLTSLF